MKSRKTVHSFTFSWKKPENFYCNSVHNNITVRTDDILRLATILAIRH